MTVKRKHQTWQRQNKLREEESGHIVNTYQQRMDGYLKELGL